MGNKYHNRSIVIDGIKFDSIVEGCRYVVLRQMELDGLITNLRRQVAFEIIPKMLEEEVIHLKTKDKIKQKTVQLPTYYKADFVYEKDGKLVVEDVKGSTQMITADFKLKKKLMKYVYNIDVQIVIIPYKEQRAILRNLSLTGSLRPLSADRT